MGRQDSAMISPQSVQNYLARRGFAGATILAMRPLGEEGTGDLKSYGYGKPLRVTFTFNDIQHDLVIRTMSADPFGHDRRADRVANLVLCHDTFNDIPRHIDAHDVGIFAAGGELVSMPEGEPFLVTNYVQGELYAKDIAAMAKSPNATQLDLDRASALGCYLANLHTKPASQVDYVRCLRDTIGSGEGLFGITDSYPRGHALVISGRLQAFEASAVAWRWRLFDKAASRSRRTHGDFHPFNILFRAGDDFSVLDCSRGAAGEPADDVCCMAINYLFFALREQESFAGALRQTWDAFFATYLRHSGDLELLEVVAPFFAWRASVLASPVWYPGVSDALRERMLGFAQRLLDGAPFNPQRVDDLL